MLTSGDSRIIEAIHHLQRAVELDDTDAAAWHRLGCQRDEAGQDPELALSALRRAAHCPDIAPGVALFWYDLSVMEHKHGGRTDVALHAAKMATKLDPDDADALCHHGRLCALVAEDDPESDSAEHSRAAAEEQYRQALLSEPEHQSAMFNLALLLKKQSTRRQEALELLRRAVTVRNLWVFSTSY